MDAKITKERLANFLAYDWLKILLSVGLVVAILCVFFTTVRTRPRDDQNFEVYGYTGLNLGADGYNFGDRALKENVFSYDVLDVTTEVFDAFETYSAAAYTARRAAGQGKILFLSTAPMETSQVDEEGNPIMSTILEEFVKANIITEYVESEELRQIVDFGVFMRECESYLSGVFGDWRTNDVPDEGAVREIFLSRNANDKRFRTAAQKQVGIAEENGRLIALRSAYLAVTAAIDRELFTLETFTSDGGNTYTVGLNVGGNAENPESGLPALHNFMYYNDITEGGESVRTAKGVVVSVFNNGKHMTDLKYDTFLFLNWLMETYSA